MSFRKVFDFSDKHEPSFVHAELSKADYKTKPSLNENNDLGKLIYDLKLVYEDFWKENNLINTSIKLPIMIRLDNKNFEISLKFEKALNSIDFINNFTVRKFDKDFILYELIFNGTPQNFINTMEEQNFSLDTQNKIWILK